MKPLRWLFFALCLGAGLGAARADDVIPSTPTADVAVSSAAAETRIGRINVVRRDVFDHATGFPYGLANTLHLKTREGYIRRELLFREGDLYDPAAIAESERLLRERNFFREVTISTAPAPDGTVNVTVETADVWTTAIRPSYGVAGGQQYYGMGVEEYNFLGEGKDIGAFLFQDIDRRIRGVSYSDTQFFGTRWNANAGYGQDEKGREWAAGIARPYYASRVRYSAGADIDVLDDEDRLFQDAEEIVNFQHRTRDGRVYASHALDAEPDRVRRVTLTYERQEDAFSSLRRDPSVTPQFPLPFGRRVVSAGLLGFDYQDIDFRKYTGVMTLDRVEDTNLGWEWGAGAGPSLEAFGATRDGAFGRAHAHKAFAFGDNVVWQNNATAESRFEADTVRDGILKIESEAFFLHHHPDATTSARMEWRASHNLDPESQFILGGANGLRAYRIREFAGANSLLATLENRRVVLYDWLKLANVGWAAFADAGSAWQRGARLRMSDVKSDVGVGLRFSLTRATDPSIIRADIAYALQDNRSASRLALNLGADIHFGDERVPKFEQ